MLLPVGICRDIYAPALEQVALRPNGPSDVAQLYPFNQYKTFQIMHGLTERPRDISHMRVCWASGNDSRKENIGYMTDLRNTTVYSAEVGDQRAAGLCDEL